MVQNLSTTLVTIQYGQRIAQMICDKAIIPHIQETKDLSTITSGSHGFESTESRTTTSSSINASPSIK